MEIVVIRNDGKGGVGGTVNTAHILFFAAELGLKVAGASIDETNELRRWLRLAGIPWFDALCEEVPSDIDLLVIDVCRGARSVEILRPSLTLIPVDGSAAEEHAASAAPTVVGRVMRLRNFWHGVPLSDDQLDPNLASLDVVVPRCNALRATSSSLRAVWASPLGAASAGARAMRELAAEVLGLVDLLPPEDAPYERSDRLLSLAEREKQGCAGLAAFFERFEATKKAEADATQPKPWMVEWVRDVESSLNRK